MATVYLDHNASTPLRPQALHAMTRALAVCGNPSSVHGPGRQARARVEDAREQVAALAGVPPGWVVFTSGGTEANALALIGAGRPRVLVSAVEHPSVADVVDSVEAIAVDGDGVVRLDALERLLAADSRPAVVSVMAANNETGVVQPVAEVARLAHAFGAIVHCDAVQAGGKIAVPMRDWGVDLLSLSAHKLGGPQGVGALVVDDARLALAPMLKGGGQESRRRAGTENVAGIAGFGAAVEAALADTAALDAQRDWRDALERRAAAALPGVVVLGASVARLGNTACLALPGLAAETAVMALDLAGVAVSAGSACSSGKVAASRVLRAMGVAPQVAAAAIRVSFGWTTQAGDVDRFITAWRDVARRAGIDVAAETAA